MKRIIKTAIPIIVVIVIAALLGAPRWAMYLASVILWGIYTQRFEE